jgi:hypothetical protein
LTPLGAGLRLTHGWNNLGYCVCLSAFLCRYDSTDTGTVTPQPGCNLIEKSQALLSSVLIWAEQDRRGNLMGMVQLGSHSNIEHECKECGRPRYGGITIRVGISTVWRDDSNSCALEGVCGVYNRDSTRVPYNRYTLEGTTFLLSSVSNWSEQDQVGSLGSRSLGAGLRLMHGGNNRGYFLCLSALRRSGSSDTGMVTPQPGCNLTSRPQASLSSVLIWAKLCSNLGRTVPKREPKGNKGWAYAEIQSGNKELGHFGRDIRGV